MCVFVWLLLRIFYLLVCLCINLNPPLQSLDPVSHASLRLALSSSLPFFLSLRMFICSHIYYSYAWCRAYIPKPFLSHRFVYTYTCILSRGNKHALACSLATPGLGFLPFSLVTRLQRSLWRGQKQPLGSGGAEQSLLLQWVEQLAFPDVGVHSKEWGPCPSSHLFFALPLLKQNSYLFGVSCFSTRRERLVGHFLL